MSKSVLGLLAGLAVVTAAGRMKRGSFSRHAMVGARSEKSARDSFAATYPFLEIVRVEKVTPGLDYKYAVVAKPKGSANGDERLERLLEIVRKYEGKYLDMLEAWRPFLRDMKEAGFETLGSGGTRYVYALDDDRVAKIDYDPDGSSNEAEYDAWRDFSRMGGGDLLVPVLGRREDGRVLIMARAKPIPKSRLKEIPKARRALALPREQADYEFNWGLHEGIVKLLDYVS